MQWEGLRLFDIGVLHPLKRKKNKIKKNLLDVKKSPLALESRA